jgi:hypothetical protein
LVFKSQLQASHISSTRNPSEPHLAILIEHNVEPAVSVRSVSVQRAKHFIPKGCQARHPLIVTASQVFRQSHSHIERVRDKAVDQSLFHDITARKRFERQPAVNQDAHPRQLANRMEKLFERFQLLEWLATRNSDAITLVKPRPDVVE